MVPENCKSYKGFTGKCENSCDLSQIKKTYKAENYKFFGGAYGKCNESEMIKEL